MSAFQTGIARILNVALANAEAAAWLHQTGVKPKKVEVLDSGTAAALAAADYLIARNDTDELVVVNQSGGPLTIDVWVHFEVSSAADGGIVPASDIDIS